MKRKEGGDHGHRGSFWENCAPWAAPPEPDRIGRYSQRGANWGRPRSLHEVLHLADGIVVA